MRWLRRKKAQGVGLSPDCKRPTDAQTGIECVRNFHKEKHTCSTHWRMAPTMTPRMIRTLYTFTTYTYVRVYTYNYTCHCNRFIIPNKKLDYKLPVQMLIATIFTDFHQVYDQVIWRLTAKRPGPSLPITIIFTYHYLALPGYGWVFVWHIPGSR